MQYMLLIHANEAAFAALPKDQVERTLGAYTALYRSAEKSGCPGRQQPFAADRGSYDGARRQWQDASSRRSVCRDQGATRRLLLDRSARSRRGDFLGGALSRRFARDDGDSADLGDLFSISAG